MSGAHALRNSRSEEWSRVFFDSLNEGTRPQTGLRWVDAKTLWQKPPEAAKASMDVESLARAIGLGYRDEIGFVPEPADIEKLEKFATLVRRAALVEVAQMVCEDCCASIRSRLGNEMWGERG